MLKRRIQRSDSLRLTQGLQLDLEIALSGVSAPNAFGVETSGDVIRLRFVRLGRDVELNMGPAGYVLRLSLDARKARRSI